jgi:hypothetical protein
MPSVPRCLLAQRNFAAFPEEYVVSTTFTLTKKAAVSCEQSDKFITNYTASYQRFHLCDKLKSHFLIENPSDRCFSYELKTVTRKIG